MEAAQEVRRKMVPTIPQRPYTKFGHKSSKTEKSKRDLKGLKKGREKSLEGTKDIRGRGAERSERNLLTRNAVSSKSAKEH